MTDPAHSAVLRRARFFEAHAGEPLNGRQRLMLNRLLDGFEGKPEFEGKLTSSKWAKIAQCSQDTALRDILDPVGRGLLSRYPAGAAAATRCRHLPDASTGSPPLDSLLSFHLISSHSISYDRPAPSCVSPSCVSPP